MFLSLQPDPFSLTLKKKKTEQRKYKNSFQFRNEVSSSNFLLRKRLLARVLRLMKENCFLVEKTCSCQREVFFFFFCIFRTAPAAYGGSQPRGPIGAAPAGLHHSLSNADLSCVFDLHQSLWQCQILNPLSEARDRTLVLMHTSQVH